MKRYYISSILIALAVLAQAQNATVRTNRDPNVQQQAGANATRSTELSVRAQMMNDQLTQETGNARWVRNILRELDLTKEKNAPLYYPVQEMNGMKNLFTSLFQLASEGKITVYGYQKESFDDDNILSFQDLLKNFNIIHETVPAAGTRPVRYIINPSDVPSREADMFYVKESWYFDQNSSTYDCKILALCPIVTTTFETGEQVRSGMFWVKYEDIRPYIKNNPIMTSNINNAKLYTMDDFFRRRMYDGEIIQTENLMNLPLAMLFETDEEIAEEQQRIENQLVSFNEALWIKPDTTTVVLNKRDAKKVSTARATPTKAAPKEKAPKQPKAPPPEKATKSAPTRSIRR